MKLIPFCFPFLVFVGPLSAKDFGICGHTFPIHEKDLIKELALKTRNSDIHSLCNSVSTRMPDPVIGIPPAKITRAFTFDPTYTLQHDIKNERNEVIIPKGTKVNPLENTTLKDGLLFLDGQSRVQLQWAMNQNGSFKWVLINGNPFAMETAHHRPVYFDQEGVLSARLGLKAVPARVTQLGSVLLIEEVSLEERREAEKRCMKE